MIEKLQAEKRLLETQVDKLKIKIDQLETSNKNLSNEVKYLQVDLTTVLKKSVSNFNILKLLLLVFRFSSFKNVFFFSKLYFIQYIFILTKP